MYAHRGAHAPIVGRVLILCDFDGTVTETDTLVHLHETFIPREWKQIEHRLDAGEWSLREELAHAMGCFNQSEDEVVAEVLTLPLRDGFCSFVEWCTRNGHHLAIVSAGFRQLIRPMLDAADIPALDLRANDITFSPTGATIRFRDAPLCATCGEHCKRGDVHAARERHETVVFIGDGYSDRCGAIAADRVFARADLARFLAHNDYGFEPFESFSEVQASLARA